MFNKFNSFRLFDVLGNTSVYNPYINYSWSQTLTVGNNQQIKDTGKSGLNLQQYFGQGVYFNGVDQNITIPINTTIQTEIKRIGGVTTVNTNTQVLTNYVVYSGTGGKIIKDLYMFNRVLTQVEIDKYNNQPNQFFMDSLEDSSCVLSMPMCEKDGFVRNYKSYNVSSTNLVGVYLSTDYASSPTPTVGTTTIASGVITQTITTISSSTNYPRIDFGGTSTRLAGKAYLYEFEYEVLSGVCVLSGFYNGVIFGAQTLQGKGKVSVISMGTIDRTNNSIYLSGMNLFSVKIWNVSVKEVTSGIHKITNYTAPSRTSAQGLPYGLQTSGFKRDNLGMILSKSNFLEADGVGYGNSGWNIPALQDFTVECIVQVNTTTTNENYFVVFPFYIRSQGSILYIRMDNIFISHTVTNGYYYTTLTYSGSTTKEMKAYVNAVNIRSGVVSKNTDYGNLATRQTGTLPLRLLKVHQKVLTQEEVTKNFNTYQAQGLLSESGEYIPNNAITDANGNYFVDANGNYIVVNN